MLWSTCPGGCLPSFKVPPPCAREAGQLPIPLPALALGSLQIYNAPTAGGAQSGTYSVLSEAPSSLAGLRHGMGMAGGVMGAKGEVERAPLRCMRSVGKRLIMAKMPRQHTDRSRHLCRLAVPAQTGWGGLGGLD